MIFYIAPPTTTTPGTFPTFAQRHARHLWTHQPGTPVLSPSVTLEVCTVTCTLVMYWLAYHHVWQAVKVHQCGQAKVRELLLAPVEGLDSGARVDGFARQQVYAAVRSSGVTWTPPPMHLVWHSTWVRCRWVLN